MGERDKDGFIGSGAGGGTRGTGGAEAISSGEGGADVPTGAGEGDDLAHALGGREGGDRYQGGDAAASGGNAPDAGSPGGMGGVRGGMPNPDHRPNGGVSPIRSSGGDDRD